MSDQKQQSVKMFAINELLLKEVFNCLTDGSYKNKTFNEINGVLMALQKMPEVIQKNDESDPFANEKNEVKSEKNELKIDKGGK